VVFSDDGKTLISGSAYATVRFWDVATGKDVQRKQLRRTQAMTRFEYFGDAALTTNGKILAARGDECVYLYDTAAGEELHRLPVERASNQRLSFSPDGQILAVVTGLAQRHVIRLWDVATGKERLALEGHKRPIQDVAFSPDGKLLVASDAEPVLRLWDTTTGQELRSVPADGKRLAVSPDGKTVAAIDREGTVSLWEAVTFKELATLKASPRVTRSYSWDPGLSFSPDNTLLAVGGEEAVVLWDLAAQKERCRLSDRYAHWIAFAPDGKTLACSGGVAIRLWDVTTAQQLHHRPGHEDKVSSLSVSPDGKVVASVAWNDPAVRLWDAATGKPTRSLKGHDCSVRSCGFSSDGKWVLAGGMSDGTVHLWEAATGREGRTFVVEDLSGGPPRLSDVFSFRLSPDGANLAAVHLNYGKQPNHYQLSVWDARTGKILARRSLPEDFQCRFTPDGKGVAMRTTSNGLTIQETLTGREIVTIPRSRENSSRTMPGGGTPFRPVAFSPNGMLVAFLFEQLTGGHQVRGIAVVEAATGKEVLCIDSRIGFAEFEFSPDGRVLATADADAIRLWDVATGKQLFRRPLPDGVGQYQPRSPLHSLCFLPDGHTLATGMGDGTILVWDLAPQTWPATGIVKDLGHKELDGLWADLAGDDVRKAHLAIYILAAAPAQAIPFLQDHLQPTAALDAKQVERLIADLDSDQFAAREVAGKELAKLGEQIEPALHKALEGTPSAELRRRAQALLAAPRSVPMAATLRTLRAIHALEHIGSPEARQVLQKLATGGPMTRETREAKNALRRLDQHAALTQ
jgi:WD40 repeat protein